MIKTKLCDMIGIKYPIVQAGMGPFITNKLCIAAANAGALGIITTSGLVAQTASVLDPNIKGDTLYEQVREFINVVKDGTKKSKGIFGMNVMVSAEMEESPKEIIRAGIDAKKEDPDINDRLRVIITSAGDPRPWADLIKPAGFKWFHVVPSVRHAKRCEQSGVDIVIASGQEGGGHVAWEPVHSMVLLPAVSKAVSIPVVGAGGFCDGRSLAAALVLGAVGIQMGTRSIATYESDFVQAHKDAILEKEEKDTLVARGFVGPLRYLKNQASVNLAERTVEVFPGLYIGKADSVIDPDLLSVELEGMEDLVKENKDKALFYGGEVAGRIENLLTYKELVEEIAREAEEAISSLSNNIYSDDEVK